MVSNLFSEIGYFVMIFVSFFDRIFLVIDKSDKIDWLKLYRIGYLYRSL